MSTHVYFTAQNHGDLRLARGSTTSTAFSSGRLEIYIVIEPGNAAWGTVCSGDAWITENSNVACRQLGFTGAASPTSFAVSSAVGWGSTILYVRQYCVIHSLSMIYIYKHLTIVRYQGRLRAGATKKSVVRLFGTPWAKFCVKEQNHLGRSRPCLPRKCFNFGASQVTFEAILVPWLL